MSRSEYQDEIDAKMRDEALESLAYEDCDETREEEVKEEWKAYLAYRTKAQDM